MATLTARIETLEKDNGALLTTSTDVQSRLNKMHNLALRSFDEMYLKRRAVRIADAMEAGLITALNFPPFTGETSIQAPPHRFMYNVDSLQQSSETTPGVDPPLLSWLCHLSRKRYDQSSVVEDLVNIQNSLLNKHFDQDFFPFMNRYLRTVMVSAWDSADEIEFAFASAVWLQSNRHLRDPQAFDLLYEIFGLIVNPAVSFA